MGGKPRSVHVDQIRRWKAEITPKRARASVFFRPSGFGLRTRISANAFRIFPARPLPYGTTERPMVRQSQRDCRFESAPKEGRTALGFRFSEFYRSLVFKATPVQISLTPRFSGVWCARDGRKPFQRFPGLRGRNGPLADIADQEAPHR